MADLRTEVARLRVDVNHEIADSKRHLRSWMLGSQAAVLATLGLLIQLH